jgi:hypothetical protein
LCGVTKGSRIGIENHINGSTDENHDGESGADHRAEIEKVSVDEPASSAPDRAESADGSGDDNPLIERGEPATDRGEPGSSGAVDRGAEPACCNDPELDGSDGTVVVGVDGDAEPFEDAPEIIRLDRALDAPMRLNTGDRVCMTCDEIHEEAADG